MPNVYDAGSSAVPVQGLLIQMGNGQSPETFITVANISKMTEPFKAKVVDVTNVSNIWMQQIPTTLSIGDLALDLFWVMEDPTLNNSLLGLRYAFANKILKDVQIIYPDGNLSTDAFKAYVTQYSVTGAVNGVFTASIILSGTGTPSLV